ncbi:MAG TPA: 50S ribosomal protein L25/general stress protein Ctc [Alphaproteobacteria bacterium]|nr:50S ribosomal protein L25/general stress protein Ctc [Alphaproteobacteria bacterium]HNS45467.1 50S ribosomal protein L25/general stress protein Ctc [Alphaproteobacteria bacterium]
MSKNYALAAQKRDRAGKGVARALRRENRIPAVIYGDNKAPVLISCSAKDITLQFQKGGMRTHICDLDVDGQKVSVLARDIQLNPVSDRVEHIDFMRVGPKTKIIVQVPLHFVGQDVCPGIKAKGVLNVVHHHLDLRCAAGDIPEAIEIDMSTADLNAAFKLSDIKLPKGAEVMGHQGEDLTLANIVEPVVKAADIAAEAAAAAAPVVAAPAAPVKKDSDKKAQGMKK